ncbi:Chaperonin-like RBCX protein 1, chloroplastic, partial [Linum perenne]
NIVGKQNQPQPKNLSNQTSMELTSSSSAAAIVPPLSSRLSFLQPNTSISAYSIRTLRPTSLIYSRSNSARLRCQKMYVPGFGESPEGKAANYLVSFFTYIALEVVASQLQSYNREGYAELMEFVEAHPLKDGDEFCAALMRQSSRHQAFGELGIQHLALLCVLCRLRTVTFQ